MLDVRAGSSANVLGARDDAEWHIVRMRSLNEITSSILQGGPLVHGVLMDHRTLERIADEHHTDVLDYLRSRIARGARGCR
jgi:hypothetical protein